MWLVFTVDKIIHDIQLETNKVEKYNIASIRASAKRVNLHDCSKCLHLCQKGAGLTDNHAGYMIMIMTSDVMTNVADAYQKGAKLTDNHAG